ncbi:MAG TPA: recombinase XerD [Phaeodactylibacter sp.]|nr:recombinase XerD [Phaeodactylibacter sp.]
MKAVIYQAPAKAKRIKVFVPYKMTNWRMQIKQMNTSFWHPQQKLWSVVNTSENMEMLKKIFAENYTVKSFEKAQPIKYRQLSQQAKDAILELEKVLTLKRYSHSTIKSYKGQLHIFFSKFMDRDVKQITKEQIEAFILELIKKHKISERAQNLLINAIKAYYEHVLGMPREYYNINRPKKAEPLPNVLSEKEVWDIINSPKNLKHKAVLWTIYSAGLRISELTRLRIVDIHSDDGYIFVKASKGKKDRKTILSPSLLPILRNYYKKYRPSYWLFEGQTGGRYSVSSIRSIFRAAVKKANANPWATVHTLRHSFATHCVFNNVNMKHIQSMLGHASPKTTEIYTKLIEINNKKVTSPLDYLMKNNYISRDKKS